MKIFPFLLIASLYFSQQLLLNTYDKTGYLFYDDRVQAIFNFQVSNQISFTDYIIEHYIPPKVSVEYIPLPKREFLILNCGKTIGTMMTDIVIPQSIYEKLVELFNSNVPVLVTIDRYPIEIYPDHILVLEFDSEKIKEFLPHFVNYDLSKITRPGKYPLKAPDLGVDWIVTSYPGFGGAIIPIFKNGTDKIEWTVDGINHSGICAVFSTGEHSINAQIAGKLYNFNVSVLDQRDFSIEKNFEIGDRLDENFISLSGFDCSTLTAVGKFVFLQMQAGQLKLIKATVTDSTSPLLELHISPKAPGIFELSTFVQDMTAYTVNVFLDGQKLEITKGILTLTKANHTIVAIAEDSFSNKSYVIKQISNTDLAKDGILVEREEVHFDVLGFNFISPYIKWWLAKDVSAEVVKDGQRYEIEIH